MIHYTLDWVMIDSYVYCVVVHTTIEVGGGLNRGRAHVKTVDQALPNNKKGFWGISAGENYQRNNLAFRTWIRSEPSTQRSMMMKMTEALHRSQGTLWKKKQCQLLHRCSSPDVRFPLCAKWLYTPFYPRVMSQINSWCNKWVWVRFTRFKIYCTGSFWALYCYRLSFTTWLTAGGCHYEIPQLTVTA